MEIFRATGIDHRGRRRAAHGISAMTASAKPDVAETRWHRFRHYPGKWSGFDQIEKCAKPKFCCGCEFNHPFCTESGIVAEACIPARTQLEKR
jgi:hypothetical protein